MSIEIKRRFLSLASKLSPENLYCDGECSAQEAAATEHALKAEWAALERKYGQAVSEQDVYEKFLPEIRRADFAR